MKKLIITAIFILICFRASAPELSDIQIFENTENHLSVYYEIRYDREMEQFIEHLGFRESKNDWTKINSIDCMGEWQFTESTLQFLGVHHISPVGFREDPNIFPREFQIEMLKKLIIVNEISLRPYECYIGTIINGTEITKAGLIAGMHLGGFGAVKVYLLSDGRVNKEDINGMKISDYIREFGIYNLSRSSSENIVKIF